MCLKVSLPPDGFKSTKLPTKKGGDGQTVKCTVLIVRVPQQAQNPRVQQEVQTFLPIGKRPQATIMEISR